MLVQLYAAIAIANEEGVWRSVSQLKRSHRTVQALVRRGKTLHHPSVFFNGFNWDDDNIEHVSRHGVTPSEAEQAVEDDNFLYYLVDESRYLGFGQTSAGRYLMAVFCVATSAHYPCNYCSAYDRFRAPPL